MYGIIGDHVINFDNVKGFTRKADHIIIYYHDAFYQEFVFNSEPEARQAFITCAKQLAQFEVENCEASEEYPQLLVQTDE